MNVTYIKHEDIDLKKWDKCIKKAVNGSIYGYSWFLNIVSENWDALIDENYENVMPLTYLKFFGVKALVQPHFATNLGVYSSQVLDTETVNKFISSIPLEFNYVNIRLNKYNKLTIANIKIERDIHYELDLIQPYEKIRSQYSKNIRENLQVSSKNRITVIPCLNSNDLIQLHLKNSRRISNLLFRKKNELLKKIVSTAVRYRVGQVMGAYTHRNVLCAAAFFVFSHQKATLLFLELNKIAIKERALEAVIDEFIKLHADQNVTLRFEFASRKKFASVYEGFGAQRFQFMNIKQNRLPSLLKLLRL